MMLRFLPVSWLLVFCGCSLLPEIAHQPSLHNPFPQLSKVAVAPFFNLSGEPTLDGRQFAMAYFNELQLIPGFEAVPVGVVERAMGEQRITLSSPAEARRLAQALGVDVLVIGAVTDYSPYYPPRCGLQVEWYAANSCFHPIPPGYGLPWGTPEEEGIPGILVLQAEMALAKEQLKTQTPRDSPAAPSAQSTPQQSLAAQPGLPVAPFGIVGPNGPVLAVGPNGAGLPPGWPDPQGFVPPPPSCRPPTCWPSDQPVMRHTRTYNGHDSQFTEALNSYYFFRDDARFGGWQSYLQRSDDFIRFCCHVHVWEMLSARGGAGETRVVWRWPTVR